MRLKLFVLSALTVTLCLVVFVFTNSSVDQPVKAADHKHEFNDYFFSVRNYPETQPDLDAYISNLEFLRTATNDPARRMASQAEWRLEGPQNIGGRMNTVAAHPNNNDIMYAGSAKGGVFKTTDGGANWTPIFDDQLLLSVSKIILDPNDPNTVYVGTGDLNITQLPSVGDGLYRSTDAGATWENLGLEETRIIADIVIDPNDSNTIYAGTMGLPYERNDDRGVYKTTDGGQSWNQVLFISDEAGVIDMEIDYNNPSTVYAVGWNRIRNNTESLTTGIDARVFRTTDGGANWSALEGGLPLDTFSRIGIAISPLNSQKLYATYVSESHNYFNTFVTEDGGNNWTAFDDSYGNDPLSGFGWFFGQVRVNPVDDDKIYILGVDLWEVSDMGQTWEMVSPPWWEYSVHADKHDLQFTDDNTLLLATDGGLYRGTNNLGYWDWEDIENIGNSQFYRVAVNPHLPGVYGGGMQDNGSSEGSVNDITDWPRIFGGDGFTVQYHPDDPDIMWVETQRGNIYVGDSYYFDDFTSGIDGDDRRGWDMPFLVSKHDPNVVYTGTYRMYKTETGYYEDWNPISDDLTDGIILNQRYHTITAINESSVDPDILMCGTVDANVWISTDGGQNWDDIAPGLPERYVTSVKTSHINPNVVFVSQSGYKDNDNESHIFKSVDQGQTWTSIAGDLPNVPVNEILIAQQDDDLLFIATDAGVFVSENGGSNWSVLGSNLPPVMTFDIEIDYDANRLIAGTFARSMWSVPLNDFIEAVDNTPPAIVYNDGDIIWTENTPFVLPDVTAFDDVDGDLTDELVITNNVDVNTPGTYTIVYEVTDSSGNSNSLEITVVVEIEPPVLSISDQSITILQGEDFDLPVITAFDPTDGDLTDQIEIFNDQIPTGVPGTYEVIVSVTDSAGNTVTETITVIVEAATGIASIETDQIQLYPNPATDRVFYKSDLQIKRVQVFNTSGQLIQRFDQIQNELDVSKLTKGSYILQFETESQLIRKTLLVQ